MSDSDFGSEGSSLGGRVRRYARVGTAVGGLARRLHFRHHCLLRSSYVPTPGRADRRPAPLCRNAPCPDGEAALYGYNPSNFVWYRLMTFRRLSFSVGVSMSLSVENSSDSSAHFLGFS